MRALIQRVTQASVEIAGATVGEINRGLLVLLGIEQSDSARDADYLVTKIIDLRIFDDEQGKMNLSVRDIGGQLLIVSQFTLYGDCRKGRRPSFDRAARPEAAKLLYEHFLTQAAASGLMVQSGVFQASMLVSLVNDGPVTLLCESGK
ncbi:MAG: D-aminoacyl-tRNA deacylase [Bryobacteraceae bacterium]